jgi:hypothetical protein
MFPPQRLTRQGPSSPGAPRVPPALPEHIPVIRPTSLSPTPYGQVTGAPGRPLMNLQRKSFPLAAEQCRADVARIADLPLLREIAYDEFDADYDSDNSSDLRRAPGKAPIILQRTEFSVKQFATRMGHPNFTAFNKWKKVWVAKFLEKKHRSIIPGQNCL